RENTLRIWNIRSAKIALREAKTARAVRQKRSKGFNHSPSQPGGQEMVIRKVFVAAIALIAGENLVSAIPSQQCSYADLASRARAGVSTECRRVGERLVVIRDDFLQGRGSLTRG